MLPVVHGYSSSHIYGDRAGIGPLADRNKFGGGVIVYMRSDLAAYRKIQYEFREIKSIGVEVTSGNEKCFFGGVYKPPSMSDEHFYTSPCFCQTGSGG
jgi:hypothetical protein